MSIGTVAACWRYPVKSMQGMRTDHLEIASNGVLGDRHHALVDTTSGRLLSAKRAARLLEASASDRTVTLPDQRMLELDGDDPDRVDAALSDWLGRPVRLARPEGTRGLAYEMTFDPPDDDAEYYEIPVPDGTFLDLAAVHLLASATLDHCRQARPDLDWDVRRFRPNLVLDVPGDGFVEDPWTGHRLQVGGAVLEILGPTVRCAMPLRAQPAAAGTGPLDRQPDLFRAITELHAAAPNHLGAYASVVEAGPVQVGDPVVLLEAP